MMNFGFESAAPKKTKAAESMVGEPAAKKTTQTKMVTSSAVGDGSSDEEEKVDRVYALT